jgi:hypothetical protein
MTKKEKLLPFLPGIHLRIGKELNKEMNAKIDKMAIRKLAQQMVDGAGEAINARCQYLWKEAQKRK